EEESKIPAVGPGRFEPDRRLAVHILRPGGSGLERLVLQQRDHDRDRIQVCLLLLVGEPTLIQLADLVIAFAPALVSSQDDQALAAVSLRFQTSVVDAPHGRMEEVLALIAVERALAVL